MRGVTPTCFFPVRYECPADTRRIIDVLNTTARPYSREDRRRWLVLFSYWHSVCTIYARDRVTHCGPQRKSRDRRRIRSCVGNTSDVFGLRCPGAVLWALCTHPFTVGVINRVSVVTFVMFVRSTGRHDTIWIHRWSEGVGQYSTKTFMTQIGLRFLFVSSRRSVGFGSLYTSGSPGALQRVSYVLRRPNGGRMSKSLAGLEYHGNVVYRYQQRFQQFYHSSVSTLVSGYVWSCIVTNSISNYVRCTRCISEKCYEKINRSVNAFLRLSWWNTGSKDDR